MKLAPFERLAPFLLGYGVTVALTSFVLLDLVPSRGPLLVSAALSSLVLHGVGSGSRYVLRRNLNQLAKRPLIFGVVLLGSLMAALVHALSAGSLLFLLEPHVPSEVLLRAALAGGTAYLAYLTYFLANSLARLTREGEMLALRTELRKEELKVALLTARFRPHFLYNALNSVAALTRKDPEKARAMCVLLGDYLRSSLAQGEPELSSLGHELDAALAYLEIERLRYGDRILFETSLQESLRDEPFPRWLLQPLLENTIRHGVSTLERPCRICLSLHASQATLTLSLENEFSDESSKTRSTKLGLRLVRERLAHLSAGRGHLTSEREGSRFRVTLLWPRAFAQGKI